MSHLDELDEYEAELELRLKKEYQAVFGLFRYCVLTQDATYLCNKLDAQQTVPQAELSVLPRSTGGRLGLGQEPADADHPARPRSSPRATSPSRSCAARATSRS